jgi:hypothetical protein
MRSIWFEEIPVINPSLRMVSIRQRGRDIMMGALLGPPLFENLTSEYFCCLAVRFMRRELFARGEDGFTREALVVRHGAGMRNRWSLEEYFYIHMHRTVHAELINLGIM